MKKQIRSIGWSVLIIIWFFASQYLSLLGFNILLGTTFCERYSFFITLCSYVLNIGVLVGIDIWRRKNIFIEYNSLNMRLIIKYIIYGIGLWFLSTLINGVFLPFFPEYGEEIETLFDNSQQLLRFMAIVIGAPLVEEYVFRGKVQGLLKQGLGKNTAIILQGILFGIIHPFGLQKIYATVLGISFGYIREKTNNLFSSTIMHMTINCIGWGIGIIATYLMIV